MAKQASKEMGDSKHRFDSGLPSDPPIAWPISNMSVVISINVAAIALWVLVCRFSYYSSLVISSSGRAFLPYMIFIGLIPVILFLHNIHIRVKDELLLPAVPADYGVCFVPRSDLNEDEKKSGAIGKVDYKCTHNQYLMLQERAVTTQTQSYYLVYTVFTLVLLLFTVSRTKDVVNRNDPFIKSLIISSMLLSVGTMISPLLSNFYWTSLPMITFFEVLFQMNVATVIALISYLVFRVVKVIL
jgi:hypothetical protein